VEILIHPPWMDATGEGYGNVVICNVTSNISTHLLLHPAHQSEGRGPTTVDPGIIASLCVLSVPLQLEVV
jgi:hypothetical protein